MLKNKIKAWILTQFNNIVLFYALWEYYIEYCTIKISKYMHCLRDNYFLNYQSLES